jgi:hypothetical protein
MSKYQIVVGNIGTVYDGDNWGHAEIIFNDFKGIVEGNTGRLQSSEPITLLIDNEIEHQFYPLNYYDENN